MRCSSGWSSARGRRRRSRSPAGTSSSRPTPSPGPRSRDTPVVTASHRLRCHRPTGGTARRHLDGRAGRRPSNFVGYRVTEKLFANIAETEATGRTNNVTGTDDDRRHHGHRRHRHRRPARPSRPTTASATAGSATRASSRTSSPRRSSCSPSRSRCRPSPRGRDDQGRRHRRLHPARRHQDGDDPARGPVGRQAVQVVGQPADRVRRLRHHRARADRSWRRSTTTARWSSSSSSLKA